MALLTLDDLPEPEVLDGELEIVREPDHISTQLAKTEAMQSIQDEILRDASRTVGDGLFFADIDPDWKEPPESWLQELGKDRAWQRFRTARYNLMCAQEAPVGTKLAAQVFVGIVKSKAMEKGGPVRLNVEKVIFVQKPPVQYPRQDVDDQS